jgi:hypothetical protein
MEEFRPNSFRSVAGTYMERFVNFVPSGADGRPASDWVLTIGRASDWTAADLDARLTNLFAPELDGTEETKAEFVAALRAKVLADVGPVREAAIKARLDLLGVLYADFTGQTTMWQLFKRVLSSLIERDAAWGDGWSF